MKRSRSSGLNIQEVPIDNLAYIGDAVYELYIRKKVLTEHRAKAGRLHYLAVHFARASFQAKAAVNIRPYLTEAEENILRRGRNANHGTMAKHASPQEYAWASALEALIGYLHLSNQDKRLEEIMTLIIIEGEKNG